MRGSFRPPGGRFDQAPPSRAAPMTTLVDWSAADCLEQPRVSKGVSADRAVKMGGKGQRFGHVKESKALKTLKAQQRLANSNSGGFFHTTSSGPPTAPHAQTGRGQLITGSPHMQPMHAAHGSRSSGRHLSPLAHYASNFSDDEVSSVAPSKTPQSFFRRRRRRHVAPQRRAIPRERGGFKDKF